MVIGELTTVLACAQDLRQRSVHSSSCGGDGQRARRSRCPDSIISTLPESKGVRSTYKDSRYKPDHCRQEAERFSSLPATTQVIVTDITPVKGTAAWETVQGIDLETKSGKPAERDNKIN